MWIEVYIGSCVRVGIWYSGTSRLHYLRKCLGSILPQYHSWARKYLTNTIPRQLPIYPHLVCGTHLCQVYVQIPRDIIKVPPYLVAVVAMPGTSKVGWLISYYCSIHGSTYYVVVALPVHNQSRTFLITSPDRLIYPRLSQQHIILPAHTSYTHV